MAKAIADALHEFFAAQYPKLAKRLAALKQAGKTEAEVKAMIEKLLARHGAGSETSLTANLILGEIEYLYSHESPAAA